MKSLTVPTMIIPHYSEKAFWDVRRWYRAGSHSVAKGSETGVLGSTGVPPLEQAREVG